MTFVALLGAGAIADPDVPWDRRDTMGQASADLRRFERIELGPIADGLAWQTIERSQSGGVRDSMPVLRKFTGERRPVGHAARRARRYSWCRPPRIGVAITSVCSGRR